MCMCLDAHTSVTHHAVWHQKPPPKTATKCVIGGSMGRVLKQKPSPKTPSAAATAAKLASSVMAVPSPQDACPPHFPPFEANLALVAERGLS